MGLRHLWLALVAALGLAASLPGLVASGEESRATQGAAVTPDVAVTEDAPTSSDDAGTGRPGQLSAGHAPGAAFRVSPNVMVGDAASERLTVAGDAVQVPGDEAAEGAVTGLAGGSEPFAYADVGDGTIVIDPAWVQRHITSTEVPILGRVTCHRDMIAPLVGALGEIIDSGLGHLIHADEYGGCWVPRRIDWDPDKPLSSHAWGLAFDINVSTNQLGDEPLLDRRLVAIFERWGFDWGGHWRRPDGMHFELARPADPAARAGPAGD